MEMKESQLSPRLITTKAKQTNINYTDFHSNTNVRYSQQLKLITKLSSSTHIFN